MGSQLRSHWLAEPFGSVSHAEAVGRLRTVMDRADRGRGHLALVRGGPASGKTTLLHDLGNAARARGAVVLTASAAVEESTLDWSLTDQLFCGRDLPREVRDAAATVLCPGSGHPLDRAVVVNDLCTVLLDLARRRPVLVCVDDVHWSDTASLQFLAGLHRRLSAAPMTVVLTEWTRRWPAMLAFSADLARRPVERLGLARLSVDDVRSIAVAALGERGGGQFAFDLHRRSGGNARLAQAMIEDCAVPGHAANGPSSEGGHVVIGQATRQAVLDCVQGWDPLLAYVARALAVLGTSADIPLVASMVNAATDEVEDAMEVLTEAGLIVGGRFRHAGMRQAVAASLSREERRAVHLRAARLLPPSGAAAVEVAPHLIAAGSAPDAASVRLLRDAADQALDSDRLRLAVECLELARRDTPPGPVRTAITRTLVRALWRLDPAAARQYLPDLRGDHPKEPASAWHDEVAAVRAGLWWGEHRSLTGIPGAGEILEHPRGAAELHLSQLLIRGTAPVRSVLPEPSGTGDPWGPVLRGLAEAATTGVTEATVVNAEQVLESCDLRDDTIGIVWWCLNVLLQGGRTTRAIRWNEAFIAEASRRGAVTWGAVLTATRADIALRLGDADTAASCAAAAMDLLPQPAMGLLGWYSGATFVMASSRLKRFDDAERILLALADPGDGSSSLHRLRFLEARGQHLLANSRPRAALDQFEEVGRRAERHGLDVPAMLPWRVDVAQAQMRLGQRQAAKETLIRHLRHRSVVRDPRSRGQALRLLAVMAERPAQTADLLTRAVTWLEQAGDRYELGLAHADLRDLERRAGSVLAGHGARPGTALRTARGTAPGAVGSGRVQTDRETDHLAHDRTGILSRSEHRVAALAAQGRSNREIAATLFITVSTVEQHLTKAYRKLAVGSRNELAGMLASADPRARHETSRHETTRHETSRHEYVRRDGRAGGLAAAT
ncbi:MAG: hypothetical protein QG622_516 [Actinomycetota bacterium]|nr:hypothetical protein [Actinomycetota bacterium]